MVLNARSNFWPHIVSLWTSGGCGCLSHSVVGQGWSNGLVPGNEAKKLMEESNWELLVGSYPLGFHQHILAFKRCERNNAHLTKAGTSVSLQVVCVDWGSNLLVFCCSFFSSHDKNKTISTCFFLSRRAQQGLRKKTILTCLHGFILSVCFFLSFVHSFFLLSGDSWMYPHQRTPMGNPDISLV